MPIRPCLAYPFLLTAYCGVSGASADDVTLKHGGVLRGEVVREADSPRSQILIGTPWGRISMPRSRVGRVVPTSPAKVEYRRRAPTVSDTADAQFALAKWCRDNGLGDELRVHLKRVLELDPEHAEARQLLGYQRRGGQWITREQLLASRGLVRHKGEFRTRQEIALAELADRREQTQNEWSDRLNGWRRDLQSNDHERIREAEDYFASLTDSKASAAIVDLLLEEEEPGIRILLIDAAARVDTTATVRALARLALECPDGEARDAAIEHLRESGRAGLAAPFIAALSSKENMRVNLAGDALASLGDKRSLRPLIDALTTTHRRRVGSDSQGDTYSFNAAAGQFAFGGGGSRVIAGEVRNPSVHQALVELTGMNFLYDKDRWRAWLAELEAAAPVDLRRDS